MPRRIDEVEVVDLPIASLIDECSGLRLDRDSTLALDVHRVENLRFHLAVGEPTATLNQTIGERALAMIDVRNDRKISDVIHACCDVVQWSSSRGQNGDAVSANALNREAM